NNAIERDEGAYVAMVNRTHEAYRESQQGRKKPHLKPQKHPPRHLTPEQKRKREEKIRRDARKGNNEDETTEVHGLTVYVAQSDQRGGSYLNPCAEHIFKELGFGRLVNLDNVRV